MTDAPSWLDGLNLDAAPARPWQPLRFAAGDLAILARPSGQHSRAFAGLTVCISETAITENDPRLLERGLVAPAARDYLIVYPDCSRGLVDDWQLEPITPEPAP